MAADGSIIIETKLDDADAQKELIKLSKKIDKMREELSEKQTQQSGIKSELEAATNEALKTEKVISRLKAELSDTQQITSGKTNASPLEFLSAQERQASITASLKEQEAILQAQNKDAEKLGRQYAGITDKVIKQSTALETAENRAAELTEQLSHAGKEAGNISPNLDKIGKKLASMARRVFVFTVILSALRQIKTYLWDVIKTNSQATTAFAQLKGALLTLAQPLISVVVPAFTLLVQVLTAVVTQIARLVAMISGKSIDATKKSAKALNDQTKALKGTGKAAKDAGKSLAAFDEINQLSDNSSSASGGGASSTDIAPDFSFLDGVDERLRKIANAVLLIGAGLALWKISSKLPGMLGEIGTKLAGMAIAIGGLMLMFDGLKDAWENGLDWTNLMEIIAGATALVGGLTIAFGKNGTAIGLVVAGLAALVTGFADAMENGVNLKNTLMVLAGIIATGLGIGMLTNSMLPALVAGIMAVLYAITVLVGNGDQLMQNFKDIFAGVAEFIDGLINQDVNKMLNGLKKMVKGALNAVLTIVGSVINLIIRGLNWLIDKINSISFSVPDWVPGLGGKSWSPHIKPADPFPIPQLAQGAVIPPNREFLAVLGDQKSGTNVEAPLETIVQAFRQALAEQGKDGSNRPIILMLDRRELGRAVVDVGNQENVRVGVSLT
nr:MAG TPA: minor tail protein [Bacteriophage sp.]